MKNKLKTTVKKKKKEKNTSECKLKTQLSNCHKLNNIALSKHLP